MEAMATAPGYATCSFRLGVVSEVAHLSRRLRMRYPKIMSATKLTSHVGPHLHLHVRQPRRLPVMPDQSRFTVVASPLLHAIHPT
jgi:hypothetical protein